MSELTITLDQDSHGFTPGEVVSGRVQWAADREPTDVELRLFWYTSGKGTSDIGVVEAISFDRPQRSDTRMFRFTLPHEPYSFSGKLISLIWAIELIVGPNAEAERFEFVMSPTRSEILLTQ
jgi:hypothetical protein